jgi:uncharacterized tellurite resistance protein B-like protein
MIDHSNISSWKKNHFFAYLYLCAVQADDKLTEPEMEKFMDQYDILKIEDSQYHSILQNVLAEYKQHSKDEKNEFIRTYVPKYFGDSQDAKELVDGLFELSISDGNVAASESELIRTIQKLISDK